MQVGVAREAVRVAHCMATLQVQARAVPFRVPHAGSISQLIVLSVLSPGACHVSSHRNSYRAGFDMGDSWGLVGADCLF